MDLPEKGMAPPRTNKSGLPISAASRNATTGPRTGSLRSYDTGRNTRPRRGRQNADLGQDLQRRMRSGLFAPSGYRNQTLSGKLAEVVSGKRWGAIRAPCSARLPLPSKMRPADRKSLRLSRLICIIAVSRKCITICMWSQAQNETSSAFLSHDHEAREGKLIAVIREFVHELHPQRAKIMDVSAIEPSGAGSRHRQSRADGAHSEDRAVLPRAACGCDRRRGGDCRRSAPARWIRRIPGVRSQGGIAATAPLPLVPAAIEAGRWWRSWNGMQLGILTASTLLCSRMTPRHSQP